MKNVKKQSATKKNLLLPSLICSLHYFFYFPLSFVPCSQLHFLFTLLSEFFSSFHRCTFSLSVNCPYLALRLNCTPPFCAQIPMNATRKKIESTETASLLFTGLSPSTVRFSTRIKRQKTVPFRPFWILQFRKQLASQFQICASPSSLAATEGITFVFFSWL